MEASFGKMRATRVPKDLSAVEWAAFEFLVDAFEGVARAQAALVGGWEGEDAQAFRDGGFEPGGEFGGGGGVGGDEFLEAALGAGAVGAVEDAADVGGDLGAHDGDDVNPRASYRIEICGQCGD